MSDITAIAAFKDNYIWCLRQAKLALIVDPGDAAAVQLYLQQQQLNLAVILITHHHPDHTGGIKELKQRWPDAVVYAPALEQDKIPYADVWLQDKDQIELADFNLSFQVMQLPGHTLGHIAYYSAPVLFCGDTLFSVGCGRLFEGTAEQLYQSLQSLAALPDDTLICCTHEYTLANIAFALSVEPENVDLQLYLKLCQQKRHLSEPTLPALMATEKKLNPFLRCENSKLQRKFNQNSALALFTYLRRAKDQFKS